jgi:hypothetical protein
MAYAGDKQAFGGLSENRPSGQALRRGRALACEAGGGAMMAWDKTDTTPAATSATSATRGTA